MLQVLWAQLLLIAAHILPAACHPGDTEHLQANPQAQVLCFANRLCVFVERDAFPLVGKRCCFAYWSTKARPVIFRTAVPSMRARASRNSRVILKVRPLLQSTRFTEGLCTTRVSFRKMSLPVGICSASVRLGSQEAGCQGASVLQW
ncbi:hypothetical protein TRVL_05306 [Trypanosoma vivax]|nr:hypothetical protein TRVL_05306 [Trypanosoma vivax]